MRCDKESLLLYAVTDRSWTKNDTLYHQVEEALKGGVTFLQLREKDLNTENFLQEAEEMKKLCAAYRVPFVINDNVEIARTVGADGVHVGQDDMPAWKVREILGEDKIIGVSAQTVEQAIKAEKDGADYLGVGAVFPTSSKADAVEVEHATLRDICVAVRSNRRNQRRKCQSACRNGNRRDCSNQCDLCAGFPEAGSRRIEKESRGDPMTIKGIIWDADGTLLDSMEIWEHAPDHYLETLGIEPEPNLGEILFEMSLEQGAKYLIDRYHLPVGVADVLEGIHCQIETFYRREVTLKPGAKELLAEFKQKGYPMILATSGDQDCIRQACERLEIRQYFTELLFCSEVGAGKDRPDIYLEAARKMNCRPDEALVVEDALHAIETAKKAGFSTAAVYDKANKEQEKIRETADIYLKSFDEQLTEMITGRM